MKIATSSGIGALSLAALVAWALGAPARAVAQPSATAETPSDRREEGLELARQAAAAYKAGRYQEAIQLYRRAHAASPDPISLHNIGRCYEAIGSAQLGEVEPESVEPEVLRRSVANLRGAVEHYRQFLQAEPETPTRGAVEARIVALDAQIKLLTRIADRPRQVEPGAPQPDPARIAAPWIIAGLGGATLTAGLVTAVLAGEKERVANDPETSGADTVAAADQANALALTSNVLFGVGGAISLAGATWGFVDIGMASPARPTAASLRVGPGAVTFSLEL